MASLQAHLRQAQHNEKLAQQLLVSLEYKDWVITITFYAAIHYVEAAFFQNPKIVHTEISKPRNYKGSYHDYRTKMIFENYPFEVWQSLRKLYEQSRIARYLYSPVERKFVEESGQEYFSDNDVRNFFQKDLAIIRQSLNF